MLRGKTAVRIDRGREDVQRRQYPVPARPTTGVASQPVAGSLTFSRVAPVPDAASSVTAPAAAPACWLCGRRRSPDHPSTGAMSSRPPPGKSAMTRWTAPLVWVTARTTSLPSRSTSAEASTENGRLEAAPGTARVAVERPRLTVTISSAGERQGSATRTGRLAEARRTCVADALSARPVPAVPENGTSGGDLPAGRRYWPSWASMVTPPTVLSKRRVNDSAG